MPSYHVRRTDRELTDPSDLTSVLLQGRFATIAMCHAGEPYLVTLSYGYDAERSALYFHVAPTGRKLDALADNDRVCATVVLDGGYEQGACKHHYVSAVLTGRMTVVHDAAEARHGMRVLLGQLEDDPEQVWEHNRLDADTVYERMLVARLDVESVTGKAGS